MRPGMRGYLFFFFNDTAPTEIYTLSLHDALPISLVFELDDQVAHGERRLGVEPSSGLDPEDRKSTRLNSSHQIISYAVFCLKKTDAPICYFLTAIRAPLDSGHAPHWIPTPRPASN